MADRPIGTTIRLRGGVKFPTGGKTLASQARERLRKQGQQIWCDSRADGIVRMKEDVQYPPPRRSADAGVYGYLLALQRFSL